ncbi:AMP-binding protein [Actinokineospora inagensis]|uniref:AMP-binding protein n=1 Tax=Actinokineospora inagensis TaxID=103730 RepID=UPI000A04FFCA|nr:AMP-binding protein [Actinokineospora inagensis]
MGRALFDGFLSEGSGGIHVGGGFTPWSELVRGLDADVRPGNAYLVDPTSPVEALTAFFTVAKVPDTVLLWAAPKVFTGETRQLGPALHAVPWEGAVDRPLWGIMTSGSSGAPKLPIGHADTLEAVALHYDAAVFRPIFDGATLATCLPLQFSAAFFMAVLPALFFRRDLVVFPAHDWRPVVEAARRGYVVCQAVPAVTAAGSLSIGEQADMSRAAVIMGAGYVTQQRVDTIRSRFRDVTLANIYGTAETGAISLDRDPGAHRHVGKPLPGKPVWLTDTDAGGIGRVATTGPDCMRYRWTPGTPPEPVGDIVTGTDYGHFDPNGNLYLDGRVDGGEKLHGVTIYPRRIERHLLDLPGVVDVRVLVRHTPDGPDHLVARVIGDTTPAQVREHCTTLPTVERPTRIECLTESDPTAYTAHGKL